MKRYCVTGLVLLMGVVLMLGCQQKAATYEEMFEQARLHQEAQEYQKAINTYKDIVSKYPDGERTDEAQFMIGFIYANDLGDTEKARAAYQVFLDTHSEDADSGMILSAEWEMDNLGRDISDIDELKTMNVMETTDVTDTETKKEAEK